MFHLPIGRRSTKNDDSPDDENASSHSFSSVSLLQNRVTATAAIPAVPAISALREMAPVPDKSNVSAIPDLSTVPSSPPKKTEKSGSSVGIRTRNQTGPSRSIFDYPG